MFKLKKYNEATESGVDAEGVNEIKQFFFEHHGDGMSMDRADPEAYARYRRMSDEVVESWRQELIAADFELLSGRCDPNDTWLTVGRLLRLISRSHTRQEQHIQNLLTRMIELSSGLDIRQRVCILEHFAGRTSHQRDGGIYLVQSQTSMTELLIKAIDVLSDFRVDAPEPVDGMDHDDMLERFDNAKESIQNAYARFGITGH